jgi:hypothetical protein
VQVLLLALQRCNLGTQLLQSPLLRLRLRLILSGQLGALAPPLLARAAIQAVQRNHVAAVWVICRCLCWGSW